jgi:hypothetical protein
MNFHGISFCDLRNKAKQACHSGQLQINIIPEQLWLAGVGPMATAA